jgi:hypothetical protein
VRNTTAALVKLGFARAIQGALPIELTVRRSAAALPHPSLVELDLQISGNRSAAISFMRLKFIASN